MNGSPSAFKYLPFTIYSFLLFYCFTFNLHFTTGLELLYSIPRSCTLFVSIRSYNYNYIQDPNHTFCRYWSCDEECPIILLKKLDHGLESRNRLSPNLPFLKIKENFAQRCNENAIWSKFAFLLSSSSHILLFFSSGSIYYFRLDFFFLVNGWHQSLQ